MCMSMTNVLDEKQFWEPCNGMSKKQGHKEYGFCQAGTSVALNQVRVHCSAVNVRKLLNQPSSEDWLLE